MSGVIMKKFDQPEYEQSLLGAILFDNRILDEYEITASLLSNSFGKQVFHWVQQARARGVVADVREVALMMPKEAGQVAELTDHANMANVRHYVNTLKESARMRGLMAMARQVGSMAADDMTYDQISEFIDKTLLEIDGMRENGYSHVSDSVPDVLKHIELSCQNRWKLSGIPTGFGKLDEMTNGWQDQDYIVVGARPSVGKTAGALNCISAALRAGHKVGLFSAEMNTRSILLRMISDWGNVDSTKLRSGFIGNADIMRIGEVCQELAKSGLFVNDTPNIPFSQLVSDARRMRRKDGVNIIFIDYMGLITNEKNNLKRYEQVSEISRGLKGLARELDIPIVVLSQLTRESQGNKPTIADLRESGSIEQDADIIILLRDMGYTDDTQSCKKIQWIVGKQRNGATGDISMIFKGAFMRMRESADEWQEPEKRKQWGKKDVV
jgi:replicative DNA helicase